MKELSAGIKAIQRKHTQIKGRTEILPQQLKTRPPVQRVQADLLQRVEDSLKRLGRQAEHINQLSANLEAAIFELKAIAGDVNRNIRAIPNTHEPFATLDVCEYKTTAVPKVGQKPSGTLVLTSRPVDLFKAEREAALLAQALRHRAKRKR